VVVAVIPSTRDLAAVFSMPKSRVKLQAI